MPEIDYFFTLVSPYAYLGHRAFLDLAAAHGAVVHYRPVMLAKVFEHSGAVPLGQRPKARQDYRFLELQRWRAKRNLPLNLQPKHFPANPSLADRTVLALLDAGHDPGDFMERIFRACWVEDRNISDPAVIAEELTALGKEPQRCLEAAESDAVKQQYAAHTSEAVRLSAIGSPTYVLNGEIFWGQDRLELLANALGSGRAPYRVPG